MPYLCRLERSKIERGAHVGHAWNTIKFYGDVDQEGQQMSYTVDLMHQVGTKKREREKRENALGWHGLRQWHRIKP